MARIYFSENDTLWVTDGTTAGTHQVSPTVLNNPTEFTNVQGTLFFIAGQSSGGGPGGQVWTSDGTASGTQEIAQGLYNYNLFHTAENRSGIGETGTANGLLFFVAEDAAHGVELWSSDGTSAGTHIFKDLNTHYAGSSYPGGFVQFGGKLFFSTQGSSLQGPPSPGSVGLWVTDGTDAGTQLLLASAPRFTESAVLGGTLFLGGGAVVRTDGTPAGTQFLGGSPVLHEGAGELVASATKLWWSGGDPLHAQLWTSDGTPAGTHQVAGDFAGSTVQQLAPLGDRVLFDAGDGTHGDQLWVSDGTTAGTQQLTLLNLGTRTAFRPSYLTSLDGEVIFSADDGVHGTQLWESDGTAAGTVALTSLNGSAGIHPMTGLGGNPAPFVKLGREVFFTADDGVNGRQLWESDGTAGGTHALTSINGGAFALGDLTAIGKQLYFTASDGTGVQSFFTDGISVQQLTSVAGSTEGGNFVLVPQPPQQIVVQPGEALASFDTSADVFLDLSLADQPQSYVLSGNDTILVGPAPTTIVASAGNELVRVPVTATGGLQFFGQTGDHTVTAAAGANFLTGGSGAELFSVTGGANWITTGSGTGHFEMSGGDNTVVASQGSSEIFNAGNAPLLLGIFAGSHQVALNDGTPIVLALGGSSTIAASGAPAAPLIGIFGGDHQLNMGAGGDTVFGVGGNGTLNGGGGTNMVDLVTGHLQVNPGPGITHLFVNGGDNTLQLQSDGGLVLVSGFDPAHLHLVIASHMNGQVFSDPSQIPTRHLADGSLLLDLGSGANGPEQMLLVGISSISSSAITLV